MSKYKDRTFDLADVILKTVVVLGITAALASTAWYAVRAKAEKRAVEARRDEQTQCLPKLSGAVTVLVDRTDPLNEAQLESLRAVFATIRKNIRKEERLAVYAIDAQPSAVPLTLIEICAPVTEQDASALTDNARKIKKRFDDVFGQPLDELLISLQAQKSESQSPIFEVVQSVARTPVTLSTDLQDQRRVLMLFSDMLQHSSRFSLYGATTSSSAIDWLKRPEVLELIGQTNLASTEVKVYLLERCGHAEEQRVARAFWEAAFAKSKAASVAFLPMPTRQEPCVPMRGREVVAPPTGKSNRLPTQQRGQTVQTQPDAPAAAQTGTPSVRHSQPTIAATSAVLPPPDIAAPPLGPTPPVTQAMLPATGPTAPVRKSGKPSDACGGRVLFARESCLLRECAKEEWKGHAQCERRKRTDSPVGEGR